MSQSNTADAILDAAQALCQARGFNAFSYKDIATQLGIKTASIHYHYPTKADLGTALVRRYTSQFVAQLEQIEARSADPKKQLRDFFKLMEEVRRRGKLCLCTMLASDLETLDPSIQVLVKTFFNSAEDWLERCLAQGKKAGSFSFTKPPKVLAQVVLATAQGMLICSRAFGDEDRFDVGSQWILSNLGA